MPTLDFLNSPFQAHPKTLEQTFILPIAPKTDIYASPSHGYVFSAPIAYRKIQASDFHRARVTVSLEWKIQYDQGGLIVIFPANDVQFPEKESAKSKETHPKWVKAGIEANDGQPFASVVARDEWADWSLAPLPSSAVSEGGKKASVTLEVRKHGNALMVLWVDGEKETMIREVQWVFCEERAKAECLVGVYGARPDAKGEAKRLPEGNLLVKFEEFKVE